MDARDIVRQSLDNRVLLDAIPDDADLVSAGVNSGEMIQVALNCEAVLERALTDEEMTHLNSVEDIRRLLFESTTAS